MSWRARILLLSTLAASAAAGCDGVSDSLRNERAGAGDEEAKRELEDDPMAGEAREGTLGMRLPLGPFLALGCIEVLFLRRWLVENVLDWLMR